MLTLLYTITAELKSLAIGIVSLTCGALVILLLIWFKSSIEEWTHTPSSHPPLPTGTSPPRGGFVRPVSPDEQGYFEPGSALDLLSPLRDSLRRFSSRFRDDADESALDPVTYFSPLQPDLLRSPGRSPGRVRDDDDESERFPLPLQGSVDGATAHALAKTPSSPLFTLSGFLSRSFSGNDHSDDDPSPSTSSSSVVPAPTAESHTHPVTHHHLVQSHSSPSESEFIPFTTSLHFSHFSGDSLRHDFQERRLFDITHNNDGGEGYEERGERLVDITPARSVVRRRRFQAVDEVDDLI
jgi:hypothetical protein